MATDGKASVPEVKAYFASDDVAEDGTVIREGKPLTARDLIALKRGESAEGSDNANAYDDLAIGIGNGTLTY
jgi:hypothetical protein